MKRVLTVLGYGLAGLVVALALTLGAFALAGQEISEPAGPPVFTTSTGPTPDAQRSSDDETRTPRSTSASPSRSPDERGGNSGHGSDDDHDDRSGSGSGDGDDSGHGSDDHDDD